MLKYFVNVLGIAFFLCGATFAAGMVNNAPPRELLKALFTSFLLSALFGFAFL